jgi:pyruvate dehydrogenase E1 component alpha subunit
MESALTFDDPLITAYRVHCQAYKRGIGIRAIIAEMLGKATGATKGKGGSMHYYKKSTNFYGGNGIVGAQIPVGTGLAFALKYQEKKNCASIMFGDGAANQGQLYESINMAYLWKLPAIFIC